MNTNSCQLFNNIDDRMPTDGSGGTRHTPTDGSGGTRRTPTDGSGGTR